jgi:hypothetical protein
MSQMTVSDPSQDRSALFAQINKGEDITSGMSFFLNLVLKSTDPCNLGLKKVTADMQTHKNPGLRSGPAPFKTPNANNSTPNAKAPPAAKPPTMVKEGKKWMVVRIYLFVVWFFFGLLLVSLFLLYEMFSHLLFSGVKFLYIDFVNILQ